jgi:PAS domain S-box-containing protein
MADPDIPDILSAALEAGGRGAAVARADGTLVWITRMFTALHAGNGGRRGENFWLSEPENAARMESARACVAEGKVWRGEVMLAPPGMGPRPFDRTIMPYRGAGGGVEWMVILERDIGQEVEAERRLRLTQHAIDHSPLAAYWADNAGRLIYVNGAACRALGYAPRELLSMSISDIDPDIQLEEWLARFRAWNLDEPAVFQARLRRRDGSCIPVEVTSSRVSFGGLDYSCSFARDLTESIGARKALEDAGFLNRQIVECAREGFTIYDHGFRYRLWNPFMEHLTGLSAAEVIGRHPNELFPFLRDQGIFALIEKAMGGAAAASPEFRFEIPSTGRMGWARSEYTPLKSADGAVVGVLESVHDITLERESERERRLLADTIAASLNEIYLFDAATYRFRYANEGGLLNLGYTLEDLRRMTPLDIKPEFTREDFEARLEPLKAGREDIVVLETVHRRADGSTYPVEIHLQLFGHQEMPVFLAVAIDLTERKRAEQAQAALEAQLIQSQKLESIGRLAGGVAHDFNNLLTVINGYCELLLGGLEEEDPLRAHAEPILQAGRQAAQLTEQLLAFSRKQVSRAEPVDLNAAVAGSLDMFRRLVGEDVEVTALLDPSPGIVLADAAQIQQVLMNLIVNARDAMPRGGKLIIETAALDLDESYAAQHPEVAPGPYVMLAVSDTGVGMEEEVRQRIFEPFFTTKGTGSGTGLGLPMVYGIVRQHRGWIWVYSEPGKGSTFKIYLPRTGRPAEPSLAQPEAPARLGLQTVLVVEDQAAVRRLTCEVLALNGYRVLEAGRGEEALRIAAEHDGPIHLMMTDVVMPGMNGRELAERMGELRPGTQVLYVSGYTENVIAHHGVLDPGVWYLPKPFAPGELLSMIARMLNTAPPGPQ